MPQMFPRDAGFVPLSPDDVNQQAEIANTLAFDYEKNRFIIADGSPSVRSQAAAVRQWIALMLRTYTHRFRIYDGFDFGHSGEDLIGLKQVPLGFVHSELAREIGAACKLCPAIDRVSDFTFARKNRTLHVTFIATLKSGERLEVDGDVG